MDEQAPSVDPAEFIAAVRLDTDSRLRQWHTRAAGWTTSVIMHVLTFTALAFLLAPLHLGEGISQPLELLVVQEDRHPN